MTRRGGFTSGEDWQEYWKEPHRVLPDHWVDFSMVVCEEENPTFQAPNKGSFVIFKLVLGLALLGCSNIVEINSGPRKGLILDLDRRKDGRNIPKNKAPAKYSSTPHPMFKLSSSALPPQASAEHVAREV